MKRHSIMIIDDSSYYREALSNLINSNDNFYVSDTFGDGISALEKININKPDIILIDINIDNNCLGLLINILKDNAIPCLILKENNDNNNIEVNLLRHGAIDILIKDKILFNNQSSLSLFEKLNLTLLTHVNKAAPVITNKIPNNVFTMKRDFSLLIIGSSTGGPSALTNIIEKIEIDFPIPIIIVQHMPDGLTKSLSDSFNSICTLNVKEAEKGEEIKKGNVYIAPAGFQTTIFKKEDSYFFNVSKDFSDNIYKPSVDLTIDSASNFFKEDLLISILTGMGEDGKLGSKKAKLNNSYIIAESEETSVVYGMPKAVIDEGLVDEQSPIYEMYERIIRVINN